MRRSGWASAGIVAAGVALLEVACRAGVVGPNVIPPPSLVVASLWAILRSGAYTGAILRTAGEVVASAVIAIAGGFGLGVAVHASGFLRRGLEPYLASYYAVPTFIFYPVFVVLFGVGSAAIVAISALLAAVAMVTATLTGLDRVPRGLTRTARMFRMRRLGTALLIQLPSAAPHLFTGARLAVAYAFIGVIASEFILSGDGLGYAIAYSYNNFDNRTMYALMLLVILVVAAVNLVLDRVDRRLQARLRG